jgi:phage-related protein
MIEVPVEIRFYQTASGSSPVERYLESLESKERAMVLDVLDRILSDGFSGAGVVPRQIDGKLWELKVTRHRLFYATITGPVLVLLHAYKKQSQKAPRFEIDVARARLKEVLDA